MSNKMIGVQGWAITYSRTPGGRAINGARAPLFSLWVCATAAVSYLLMVAVKGSRTSLIDPVLRGRSYQT